MPETQIIRKTSGERFMATVQNISESRDIEKREVSTLSEGPIGVFDSGYGGLTILREICRELPQYDYLYIGDNARAPYGSRSFELVYDFTLQAVKYLFSRGCNLVVLACNTASAKALRSIQQQYIATMQPDRRVLGVIRPTVEALPSVTRRGHVGVMATPGTVASHSYTLEANKIDAGMVITEVACPMFVPLIENGEAQHEGADYFVKKYCDTLLERDPEVDTLLLGCTHYPIIYDKLRAYLPETVRVLPQGELVAKSLADYLKRHSELERFCSKHGEVRYFTTEEAEKFDRLASAFMGEDVRSTRVELEGL